MREQYEQEDRWPTINLQEDQLEQILATDVVETMRIDKPMAIVLARLEGRKLPPPQPVRYGAPIAYCTLAIVLGSAALLLESGLWRATWRLPGIIAFAALAIAAAATAITTLIVRLRKVRGARP